MKAMVTLSQTSGKSGDGRARGGGGSGGKKPGGKGGGAGCTRIVKMIMEKDLAPVIVFSFSKRECEEYAKQLSKLDFNSGG